MKDKDLSWHQMREVMAAIESYLEEEAREQDDPVANAFQKSLPEGAPSERQNSADAALHVVQYYLTRQGGTDKRMLENLPHELFVAC
ncbi:hypothetical protein HQ520_03000 [bacterium]|nr:hypothetical protein [bacterium]